MKNLKLILSSFKFVFLISLVVVIIMLATSHRAYVGQTLIVMFTSLALYFMSHRFLKSFAFTAWVFAFVAVSMVYPGIFLIWFKKTKFEFDLGVLIVPLIQIIMFGMGTTLCLADFGRVLKMPWPVFIGMILQFTVMPFVGLGLAILFGFSATEPEIAAGMVLIGSCPGGVASNLMAFLAGGNVALSVTMTSCSTLMSPVMTPFLMQGLAGKFIEVNFLAMMFDIINMIIVPIAAGLIANRILYSKRRIYHSAIPVAFAGIVFLTAGFWMAFGYNKPAVYTYDSIKQIETVIKDFGVTEPNYALIEGLKGVEFIVGSKEAAGSDETDFSQAIEYIPVPVQKDDINVGFILVSKDSSGETPDYTLAEDAGAIEALLASSREIITNPDVAVTAKGMKVTPISLKKDGFVVGFFLIGVVALAQLVVRIMMQGPEHWMDKVLPLVSMFGICFIIAIITARSADKLLHVGVTLIGAAVIHNAVGYILGYWGARIARLNETDCRTVAIEVGLQNGGMASGLAMNVLKSANAALAPAIFGPWMNISGSVLATWWRRKPVKDKKEQSVTSEER